MKSLFILMAAAVMAVSMMAEGHLKFKGVEITGNQSQFVAQLVKRVCETGFNGYNVEVIQADFAGVDMFVNPLTTSQSKTVYAVVASTRKIDDSASLKAQYHSLKQLMDEKYGEGTQVKMEDGYFVNGIGVFERKRVDNAYQYTTPNGEILLCIHWEYSSQGNISVEYYDKANGAIKDKEASDDI